MRRAVTTSISIEAPVSRVISYIARPENMPEWFRAMLDTGGSRESGDAPQRGIPAEAAKPAFWVEVDGGLGTVDYFWKTTGGIDIASARVIPVDAGSQLVLTLFEPPSGCEGCGSLEERAAALQAELAFIKTMLESGRPSANDTWH